MVGGWFTGRATGRAAWPAALAARWVAPSAKSTVQAVEASASLLQCGALGVPGKALALMAGPLAPWCTMVSSSRRVGSRQPVSMPQRLAAAALPYALPLPGNLAGTIAICIAGAVAGGLWIMLAGWLRAQFGVETAVGALNRRLVKEFDALVVTSDYAAEEFSDLGANLWKVPLGVDLETFNPDKGSPIDDGLLKLCYVGRMSHEKNPELALAAALELHRRGLPVQMNMYGVGPDLEKMKEQAGDAPVVFHGFVKGREQVARCFAASDVSLSVCPSETFGLAVLEALACGTPVVTSDRGGAHELVDASSGEYGPPDPAGLADAVERLLPRLGVDQRRAARARAEQYSWQASVDTMLELHTFLADNPPAARPVGLRDRFRNKNEVQR